MGNVGDIKGGRPFVPSARGPERSTRPAEPVAEEAPPDGYRLRGNRPSELGIPMRSVEELLPDLRLLSRATEVPQRFAADLKLLFAQLNLPTLPPGDRAQRVFEFFTKYAEAFVRLVEQSQQPGQKKPGDPRLPELSRPPEARPPRTPAATHSLFPGATVREQVPVKPQLPPAPLTRSELKDALASFSRTLGEHGFETFHAGPKFGDAKTAALVLLKSSSLAELQHRAAEVKIAADVYPPGQPQTATKSDARETRRALPEAAAAHKELVVNPRGEARVNPLVADAARASSPARAPKEPERAARSSKASNKVLGSNMLWNVLHRVRGENQEEALFKDQLDRLTFGAVLFMVFVAIAIIALVNL